MKKLLIIGLAAIALASGAIWIGSQQSDPQTPAQCAFIDAAIWPETTARPSLQRFDAPFDAFYGVSTGMMAQAACASLLQDGFALVEHDTRQIAFGSPERDMSYVDEMVFEAMTRPVGVGYDSLATVTIFIGAPVTGYQVEAIEVSYFFAEKETPEPETEAIRAALMARYGAPTSADFNTGRSRALWVITQNGMSDVPADEACDNRHLDHRSSGSILDRPADESCIGLLKVLYGGNNNEEITTARYLRLTFLDNKRIWINRRTEYSVSQAYRNRSF